METMRFNNIIQYKWNKSSLFQNIFLACWNLPANHGVGGDAVGSVALESKVCCFHLASSSFEWHMAVTWKRGIHERLVDPRNAVDPHLSRRLCNSVRSVPRSLVKTSRIMPGIIWPVNEHETFWMLSECNSRKQHEAWRGRPSDFLAKASRAVNVRMRGSPVVPAKLSELPAIFLGNEKLWT